MMKPTPSEWWTAWVEYKLGSTWITGVVFQLLSHVWLFASPWAVAHQASLSSAISWNLLKLMSIEAVMPFNLLILYHPLLVLLLIFPSISVFFPPLSESVLCIRWPKDWSFSISLSMNSQGWFPLGLAGLISLLFKGFSRAFSSTTVWMHQFFGAQPFLWSNTHIYLKYPCLENSMDRRAWWATVHGVKKIWTQLTNFHFLTFVHDYWKSHNWLYGSLSAKVMSLLSKLA